MNELTSLWLSGTSASFGGLHRLCKLLQFAGNLRPWESRRSEPCISVVELPAGTTAEALAALVEAAAQSARHDLSQSVATSTPSPPQVPVPSMPDRRRRRWPETTTTLRRQGHCARSHRDAVILLPRPASRPSS